MASNVSLRLLAPALSLFLAALVGCTFDTEGRHHRSDRPPSDSGGRGDTDSSQSHPDQQSHDTAASTQQSPPDLYGSEPFAFAQNERLGSGINLANFMDSPQREGAWLDGRTIQERFFKDIKAQGFSSVRLPVRWSDHAQATSPYHIEQNWLRRVEQVVHWALAADLLVVLDVHHYVELEESPENHQERFLALWDQIATHFRDEPPELLFEPLSQPALNAEVWNELLAQAMARIRRIDPSRTLIVDTIDDLDSPLGLRLELLELPENAKNVIVGPHLYEPLPFTHSGADWLPTTYPEGAKWSASNPADRLPIDKALNAVTEWAARHNRPIFIGQFGSIDLAESQSRLQWTSYVVESIDRRGFSSAYWDLCAQFAAYDCDTGRWNALGNALVGR